VGQLITWHTYTDKDPDKKINNAPGAGGGVVGLTMNNLMPVMIIAPQHGAHSAGDNSDDNGRKQYH
jgi:hypothetical protein